MALIPCPDCQKDLSSEAFVCPHCGRPTGKQARVQKKVFIRMIVLWVVLIIAFSAIWQFLGGGK